MLYNLLYIFLLGIDMKIAVDDAKKMLGSVLYVCAYKSGNYGKPELNLSATSVLIKEDSAEKYNSRLKKSNPNKIINLNNCHIFDNLDECNSWYISLLRS